MAMNTGINHPVQTSLSGLGRIVREILEYLEGILGGDLGLNTN